MTDMEKVAQWMLRNSFATGHGDTIDDLLTELEWQVRELRSRQRPGYADQMIAVCEALRIDEEAAP